MSAMMHLKKYPPSDAAQKLVAMFVNINVDHPLMWAYHCNKAGWDIMVASPMLRQLTLSGPGGAQRPG